MKLTRPIHVLKRKAKLTARRDGVPLHAALDGIAAAEGFSRWSLLAARHAGGAPARRILDCMAAGELLLLAALPGQGKTLLALQLAIEAALRQTGDVLHAGLFAKGHRRPFRGSGRRSGKPRRAFHLRRLGRYRR